LLERLTLSPTEGGGYDKMVTLDEEIDNLEKKYYDLKQDFETALNYFRVTESFEDLKARFYKAKEEYYHRLGLEAIS